MNITVYSTLEKCLSSTKQYNQSKHNNKLVGCYDKLGIIYHNKYKKGRAEATTYLQHPKK